MTVISSAIADLEVNHSALAHDVMTSVAAALPIITSYSIHYTKLYDDLDVNPASRHIGSDGDGTLLARVLDDLPLLLVVFCIEHGVGDLLVFQKRMEFFRLLDGSRTDSYNFV